jgi:hypothetical protein
MFIENLARNLCVMMILQAEVPFEDRVFEWEPKVSFYAGGRVNRCQITQSHVISNREKAFIF